MSNLSESPRNSASNGRQTGFSGMNVCPFLPDGPRAKGDASLGGYFKKKERDS